MSIWNKSGDSTSWFGRLKTSLSKTRDNLGKKILGVFGAGKIDDNLYEELENILLSADIGYTTTTWLLKELRDAVTLKGLKDRSELHHVLKNILTLLLLKVQKPLEFDQEKPAVIMMVGVNGAGKTTSIGKLAKFFQNNNKSVLLAAGDTFRAAAREQLLQWGQRNNVHVITQQSSDAASVCYDAICSAQAKNIDVVIADTAGRLPTQLNLMEEVKKIKRVITKAQIDAPHEIILVLDATVGQNAISQVKAFDQALGLSGIILTKLDGSAKGGAICAIAHEFTIPIYFIGVGEALEDLQPFSAEAYVEALLDG